MLKNLIKKKLPFVLNTKRSLEDLTSLFNAQLSEIYNRLGAQDKEKVDEIAKALKSCNTSSEE